jgi:hypothetical protein
VGAGHAAPHGLGAPWNEPVGAAFVAAILHAQRIMPAMPPRTWHELVSEHDDAIALIREWAAAAPFDVEILACEPTAGRRALEALQVSTRSPLGALAFHTGGLMVDHGWLRVLGAGGDRLPRAVDTWNAIGQTGLRFPEGLLVADDAAGGFFAWFNQPRTIHYLAPDTLKWEDLGLGHTEWLAAMLTDGLAKFYAELRWEGWQDEVRGLDGASAISFQPFLWTKGAPIKQRSRRGVPVEELWALSLHLARELAERPDGADVETESDE